jgi:hypothetical protein
MRKIKPLNQEKNMNPSIYFPFGEYEREIHSKKVVILNGSMKIPFMITPAKFVLCLVKQLNLI